MDTREHGGADAIYDAHARIAARGRIAADARRFRAAGSMSAKLATATINATALIGWTWLLLAVFAAVFKFY